MRRKDLQYVHESGWPVVVRIPAYKMKEMKQEGMYVAKYMEASIKSVYPLKKRPCRVVVEVALGERVDLSAGSVLKLSCGVPVNEDTNIERQRAKKMQKGEQLILPC